MYCWQACPCIFRPGNFTGRGSGGVKQQLKGGKWKYTYPVAVVMCPMLGLFGTYHNRTRIYTFYLSPFNCCVVTWKNSLLRTFAHILYCNIKLAFRLTV